MNKREAAIITAYTGILIGEFREFHGYAEEILGKPIFTHQFANKELSAKIKELSRPDFLALDASVTPSTKVDYLPDDGDYAHDRKLDQNEESKDDGGTERE